MDDALLAAALKQIPDRQWFSILTVAENPLALAEKIGFGDCHDELRDEFIRLKGRNVRIGQDPFDQLPTPEFFETPEDVLALGFLKHPQPHVTKNRTGYSRFDAEPNRYLPFLDFW